jgi:Protein of unknown function (DUF3987)
VATFRDEMTGWFGSFGRYSSGTDAADRQFYCQLRDGGPYLQQRRSTPDIFVDHCAGSFLGAVQPDRLREVKLPRTDGLLQRFMVQYMRPARQYEDSTASKDARLLLRPIRDRLAALVPEMQPDPFGQLRAVPFKLTSEGSKLYEAFVQDMRLAGQANNPSREFAEHLIKLGPMWLSFALLFHLIEDENKAPAKVIPLATTKRADVLVRSFFIPHARLFYSDLTGGRASHQSRSVASAILRCPNDTITLREVVHRCHAIRDLNRDEHIRIMQRFEANGWLTRLGPFSAPVPHWRRLAGLKGRFEAELEREKKARAKLSEAIKADRTFQGGNEDGDEEGDGDGST